MKFSRAIRFDRNNASGSLNSYEVLIPCKQPIISNQPSRGVIGSATCSGVLTSDYDYTSSGTRPQLASFQTRKEMFQCTSGISCSAANYFSSGLSSDILSRRTFSPYRVGKRLTGVRMTVRRQKIPTEIENGDNYCMGIDLVHSTLKRSLGLPKDQNVTHYACSSTCMRQLSARTAWGPGYELELSVPFRTACLLYSYRKRL